jgi:ketosteroid isomerase-like protein
MTHPADSHRSTREVLEHHIDLRLAGRLDDDLRDNYAADVVAVSLPGAGRGHDAIRAMASDLDRAVPDATFHIDRLLVEGDYGLLVWSAESPAGSVCDGTDAFAVRDGRIVAHTVHFHVMSREVGSAGA